VVFSPVILVTLPEDYGHSDPKSLTVKDIHRNPGQICAPG